MGLKVAIEVGDETLPGDGVLVIPTRDMTGMPWGITGINVSHWLKITPIPSGYRVGMVDGDPRVLLIADHCCDWDEVLKRSVYAFMTPDYAKNSKLTFYVWQGASYLNSRMGMYDDQPSAEFWFLQKTLDALDSLGRSLDLPDVDFEFTLRFQEELVIGSIGASRMAQMLYQTLRLGEHMEAVGEHPMVPRHYMPRIPTPREELVM